MNSCIAVNQHEILALGASPFSCYIATSLQNGEGTVYNGEKRAVIEPHYLPAWKSWLRVFLGFFKGKPALVFPHHSKELRKKFEF